MVSGPTFTELDQDKSGPNQISSPGSNIWGDSSRGSLVVGRCSQGNSSHYPFRQLQHGDADCDDEVDGQHDDEKDMSNSDGGIHDGSCMFKCILQCFEIFCVLRRPTAFAARTMEAGLAAGLIFRTGN